LGQLVASHRQAPATQRWPPAQGPPLPHEQPPFKQVSPAVPQSWQIDPPLPHSEAEADWHAPFEQHPPSQVLAEQPLHVPPVQVWGCGQCWQAVFFPHSPGAFPARQLVPSQQPPSQER
jgi:hypothetical protein